MDLTKNQTEKANKLLQSLCESKTLDNIRVDSFFDNSEEELFICKFLERKNLLKAIWLDGNKIAVITSNENTCNAIETNLLMREFKIGERQDNKEQLETEVLKLQKENLDKSGIIRLDVFELVHRQPILNYRISVVDRVIVSVDNNDVPKKGAYKAIDTPIMKTLVICNLTNIEKYEFGSQLTHKFKIRMLSKNFMYLKLTDNDLIKLGFLKTKQVVGKSAKLWIWIKKFHKAILFVVGGLIVFLTLTSLLFQNYEYLKQHLNPREPSLQQALPTTDDNNTLKTDTLND